MKIKMSAKCSDMCSIDLVDNEGKIIAERSDYVPKFFPGQHYGDYVIFDIDLETGQILNWKKPTQEQIDEAFSLNKDEE